MLRLGQIDRAIHGMELLVERQRTYTEDARRRRRPDARLELLPPLLTWFVRDGDEDLVEMPEPPEKPRPKLRYYRPASHWQGRVKRIESEMIAVAARADVGDLVSRGRMRAWPETFSAAAETSGHQAGKPEGPPQCVGGACHIADPQ